MGYVPQLPFGNHYFLECRKVLPLLPLQQPKSEECREKMYPKEEFPFLFLHLPQILFKSIALFQNVSVHHV